MSHLISHYLFISPQYYFRIHMASKYFTKILVTYFHDAKLSSLVNVFNIILPPTHYLCWLKSRSFVLVPQIISEIINHYVDPYFIRCFFVIRYKRLFSLLLYTIIVFERKQVFDHSVLSKFVDYLSSDYTHWQRRILHPKL